jgi:hypothetical protein
LVVEEAFASRRDTLVMPRIEHAPGSPVAFTARLRLPDGTERTAAVTLDVAHVRGDRPPFAMVRFPGTAPEAIPPGTEIWRD